MFYSHQLLARKAPLGQIWMAATMHAKMNRRKLDKLNIIQICEEILNPSVPMALRLSGILMGGVVIVYERKVKLLYDDVNRFLVEINEAWKVKGVSDPTVLPRGKSQAKREAVTLPDHVDTDLEDIERPLHFSNTSTTMGFQQTAYFAMRLDSVDEPFIRNQPMEEDTLQQLHQADADNITLFDRFDSYQPTDLHDRFERFDIEGDEETQMNFNSGEHTQIPTTFIPSPPRDEPQRADEIPNHHPEFQVNQQSDERKEAYEHDQQGPRARKRRTRRTATIIMDYDQTIIPGPIYQSWLQGASDIVSRRGRKRKNVNAMSTVKLAHLMELPPIVLCCGLIDDGDRKIHYPAPLLELWRTSTQPPHDSPSGRTSAPQPPEPSSISPSDRVHYGDPIGFPSEDLYSRAGSQSVGASIEKQRENINHKDMINANLMEELRANLVNNGKETENMVEELRANLMNNGVGGVEANLMVTPGNSGDEVRSIPSSGSGHGIFSHSSEVNVGRLNKKRHYSPSRHSSNGLEPVAEENLWQHTNTIFKLSRQPEMGHTLDQELLEETGPTQTQHPVKNHPMDQITDSIRMQMKAHFDTPGTPPVESLNSLASGMNNVAAARLFYQTCVLVSRDILRVEQVVPYGDIMISRGTKM